LAAALAFSFAIRLIFGAFLTTFGSCFSWMGAATGAAGAGEASFGAA